MSKSLCTLQTKCRGKKGNKLNANLKNTNKSRAVHMVLEIMFYHPLLWALPNIPGSSKFSQYKISSKTKDLLQTVPLKKKKKIFFISLLASSAVVNDIHIAIVRDSTTQEREA